MAGLGAAINTGNVGRGDSVAVIGCGGVGAAAVVGARLAGAAKIIAIDIDDRKLATARELGATDVINSRSTDPVAGDPGAHRRVRRRCGDRGGRPPRDLPIRRSTPATWPAPSSWSAYPRRTMKLELPLLDVFGRGGSLKSSWYGDCLPDRDFPMLIDLYLQGRLPLDAFVTEEIGIDDVEAAFDRMHGGDVLRSVVIMDSRQ